MARTEHELRCLCRRKPLLAIYGTEDGVLYIHVKVYKQGRIYGEIVVKNIGDSDLKLRCRECQRWNNVAIKHKNHPVLEETTVKIEDDGVSSPFILDGTPSRR